MTNVDKMPIGYSVHDITRNWDQDEIYLTSTGCLDAIQYICIIVHTQKSNNIQCD